MAPKSVGFKLGIVVAGLHLLLVLLAYASVYNSMDAQAGLVFIPFFFLDAPLLFLANFLPSAAGDVLTGQPLIIYGALGSALWFALPWLVDRLVTRIFPNARRWARWLVAIASLPAFFFAFIPLSTLAISQSIRDERPEELKSLLKQPADGILSKRTVLETKELGGICGIHPAGASGEILVACHRGVLRLDRQYAVQSTQPFPDYFQSVAPLITDGVFSGQFIVHRLFEHAALLGPDGQELWRAGEKTAPGQMVEGVRAGDIDGDGRPEFAVFYGYGEGIWLVDEAGKPRWKFPVDSLDHLEMADVRGNGKQEILIRESPYAFRILDAAGQVAAEPPVASESGTFALVAWPVPADRPNLVLAEDNQIRIVDLDGTEVRRLEAPGCRSYGEVAAIPVKFRPDAPAYLAVRKMLHPDLVVLYAYDAEGQLVHHDAEVVQGSGDAALAAAPAGETGAERLLVGSGDGFNSRLLEYALE